MMANLANAKTIGLHFFSGSDKNYFAELFIGESEDPSSVTVYFVFDRDVEKDSPTGLAHYTEHLVALNSFAQDILPANRHTNAYTNSLAVVYSKKGPKKELVNILEKLSKVFEPLTLDSNFATEEVDIVLREFDIRMANSLDNQSYSLTTAFLYQGNAQAILPLGTQENIASLSYEKARAYHKATHRQSAAMVLVLGDVSRREVHRAIESAGIQPLTTLPETQPRPAPIALRSPATDRVINDSPDAEPRINVRKVVALEQAVNFDLLEFQTEYLRAILDTNLPGGVAGPLRYDNFIARGFTVAVYPVDERHFEIWFDASPDSGVSFAQLQLAFEKALESAATGIPANTFERVKKRLVKQWPDWKDNKDSREWMAGYAHRRVSALRKPASREELKTMSTQVTLEDIDRLLQALQKPGRKSVVYIGNSKGEQ